MSSKPEAQNEPTMEEILASIRRIISEDEPQGGRAADSIPPATPAKATQQPAAEARGADNILELTKMVAPDGSIVDLAAEAEPEGPAVEEAAEPFAAEEPLTEELGTEELGAEEPDVEPVEEPADEPAAEAAPDVAEEASVEELLTPARDAPADEEEEPADDAPADDAPDDDAGARAVQVPAPASDGSEYVSAATAAAATASLAAVTKAAMANRQGGAVAIGGGRTLEELVRESLAPELKGWLDDNLPDLVERIVREEIRKMVRRAEEQ